MPVVEVYTGYTPRACIADFHDRKELEAVLITHRQLGKTVCLANDAVERCLENKREFPAPAYAWFYPTRVRAKDIAWKYLKHYAKNIPGVEFSETELRVTLPPHGGTVTLYGADKSRGVGLTLDGVYYDEADEIPPKIISEVEPTLAVFNGFTVWAGMLRGRHNLFKRYTEGAAFPGKVWRKMIRASESGIFDPEQLAKMKRTMGEAAYEMQMECDVNASIANAIYGKQMDDMRREGRIMPKLTVDQSVPLYAFADIGHSLTGDDWSWWFIQLSGRDILVHKYYANTGEIPKHYADLVLAVGDDLKMRVSGIYLPHDGTRKDRHGHTAIDDLEAAGLTGRVHRIERTPNRWDSINDVRATLPNVWISQEGCGEGWKLGELDMPSGIDCLDYYTKRVEATTGMIKEEPVHDQYSHGADAFRTFVEAWKSGVLGGNGPLERQMRVADIVVNREPTQGLRRTSVPVYRTRR
jgi:hypothetical protein